MEKNLTGNITKSNLATEIVDTDLFTEWMKEDSLLGEIACQQLAMLKILKTKYEKTSEYTLIRSNIFTILEKITAIRNSLITGNRNEDTDKQGDNYVKV